MKVNQHFIHPETLQGALARFICTGFAENFFDLENFSKLYFYKALQVNLSTRDSLWGYHKKHFS